MSSKITRELMEYWNVDVQTLHDLAKKNTPQMLGIYLKEVTEIIREMMEQEGMETNESLYEALNDQERTPMYVLSNIPRNSGAVNIFVEGVLKSLSEKLEDDLYIIPSSIHEVLLIPVNGRLQKEETGGSSCRKRRGEHFRRGDPFGRTEKPRRQGVRLWM